MHNLARPGSPSSPSNVIRAYSARSRPAGLPTSPIPTKIRIIVSTCTVGRVEAIDRRICICRWIASSRQCESHIFFRFNFNFKFRTQSIRWGWLMGMPDGNGQLGCNRMRDRSIGYSIFIPSRSLKKFSHQPIHPPIHPFGDRNPLFFFKVDPVDGYRIDPMAP